MRPDLEPAKKVLQSFLAEIESIKEIRKGMSSPIQAISFSVKDQMPEFDLTESTPVPDMYWEKDDAYTWLYASPRYHPLMHRNRNKRSIPAFYSQLVQPLFEKWLTQLLDVQNIERYHIPKPLSSETLQAYIERLQSIVIDHYLKRCLRPPLLIAGTYK